MPPAPSGEQKCCVPAGPGSYILYLRLPGDIRLPVGRLGVFDFPTGDYLYLGSARGPGGIRARLRHHFRLVDRPRWHLDWLRPHVTLLGGWYTPSPGPLECDWSQAVHFLTGTAVPAPGFGAADCRRGCPAHLLRLPDGMPDEDIERCLGSVASQPVLGAFGQPDILSLVPS